MIRHCAAIIDQTSEVLLICLTKWGADPPRGGRVGAGGSQGCTREPARAAAVHSPGGGDRRAGASGWLLCLPWSTGPLLMFLVTEPPQGEPAHSEARWKPPR